MTTAFLTGTVGQWHRSLFLNPNTYLSLVSGFTEMTDSNKENVVTLNTSSSAGAGVVTPKKSSSVPLGMDGAGQGPVHQHQGSASKKRKLFTQSLGMGL